MDTEGVFAPETADEARQRYETLSTAANGVVREIARAMSFDTEEYDERVTDEVIDRARQSLFASLLEVRVGSREEFESWQDGTGLDVVELGSEHVDSAVWHAPPFAETAVVATFQNEREAAVDTLRRQAFGRLYADLLGGDAPA